MEKSRDSEAKEMIQSPKMVYCKFSRSFFFTLFFRSSRSRYFSRVRDRQRARRRSPRERRSAPPHRRQNGDDADGSRPDNLVDFLNVSRRSPR